ncbi:F-box/kelch-repeat protein At5g26960 [Euphorbia lathyris]|uniref:F-box/kelch-repeat protein At5g26960 n=1 Tax=Euphorbia lathyris TaxID=212925 RepID=UPI003314470C
MSDSCNSRHFSWIIKSCFPNSNSNPILPISISTSTSLSSLPDDLLLECLTRLPSSSLPSLPLVCRRWSHLLRSPSFLSLRRFHNLIHPTVFAFSTSHSSLFALSLRFQPHSQIAIHALRKIHSQIASIDNISHSRLSSIGPIIYIITPNGLLLSYHTWTAAVSLRSSITFPRKKFATAVVSGKIYVAGGGSRAAAAVEEYDPETDSWTVVAQSPRKRFGCTAAAVDGVFYVIGGLKIGPRAADAHVYASSMDLYDVEARAWLKSRAVPGGGCVVAACSAAGYVYILASHAVELSFWRFDARRQQQPSGGFGEWCRIRSPPLPTQVRLDSTVRFSCVGVEDKVVLIQVAGCIDDLLRRSGRNVRGLKEGLVLVYYSSSGEWSRGPDLPEVIQRSTCVTVEC